MQTLKLGRVRRKGITALLAPELKFEFAGNGGSQLLGVISLIPEHTAARTFSRESEIWHGSLLAAASELYPPGAFPHPWRRRIYPRATSWRRAWRPPPLCRPERADLLSCADR